jgi:hypothetical protein
MELPALVGGKKREIGEKQALAAIGQGRLIALWDQLFGMLKQPIAQILMTRNDIADVSHHWRGLRGARADQVVDLAVPLPERNYDALDASFPRRHSHH